MGVHGKGTVRRILLTALALAMLAALAGCGGLAARKAEAPDEPLAVLMYHHFVADGEECSEWTTTDACFREDLAWLRDHGYTFVLPRELAAGEPLPEKPVMLTFDDGYNSNYTIAYPILEEFGAKAVIAVITSIPNVVDWSLTWDQCRELEASGLVEIGSHTHALHAQNKTYGTYGVQRWEGESRDDYTARVSADLQMSADTLAAELGHAPVYLAYPHGATDAWADELVRGIFAVTTTTKAQIADAADGLYDLPRFNMNEKNRPWMFLE